MEAFGRSEYHPPIARDYADDFHQEEKYRHAQQYPDYRFQPRHKSKTSPTSANSGNLRCNKCGGRSIIATGSPFLTPPTTGSLTPSTPQANTSTENTPGLRLVHKMHEVTLASSQNNPRFQSANVQLGGHVEEGSMDNGSLEAKRRRFNGYTPNTPHQESARAVTVGMPAPGHFVYSSPRGFEARRVSLPPPSGTPHHVPRGSAGRSSIPPPAGSPRSGSVVMGPPPRVYVPGQLHAYTPTPITTQTPHGLPMPSQPRKYSEGMRLPPLQSPGASDQSRSVEAMVMGIPYLGKIKLLRRHSVATHCQ